MKKSFVMMILLVFAIVPITKVLAQKVDEERMKRDIEVAENVLSTLIRQQFNNQRTFFPLEVKGTYQEGYGVTFSLPADFTTPIVFSMPSEDLVVIDGGNPSMIAPATAYSYEYRDDDDRDVRSRDDSRSVKLKDKAKEKKRMDMDSIKTAYNKKVIDAAKMFIVDYGDMITQLAPGEKIVITNQGNQPRMWVNQYFNTPKRTHISIEGVKSDIAQFKQGKLSRDQALNKLKVVNTETVETVEPDLELLVSMFNRLYRPDLSKTFFTENNIYYERLKDFGAIYYMQVYSSNEVGPKRFRMPTVGLEDVDMETRNKKIKELFPRFEQELKENILEYGRTVKSLKDEEVLVFQVKVTKCPECGIPSTLEYSIKGNVLKDFSAGKIEKNNALGKITVKKGPNQ